MLAQDFQPHATPFFAKSVAILAAAAVVLAASAADAKPKYPGEFTSDDKLEALEKKVGAQHVPIERPQALAATKKKLAAKSGKVRVLHLGDSHIASDYITGRIRHRLQKAFGDGGRGFTHVDQAWGYGGRRVSKKGWDSDRIVDKDRAGRPFGFSGMSLESSKKGASIEYRVEPDETSLRVYYYQQPGGGTLTASMGGKALGSVKTAGEEKSLVWTVDLSKAPRGAPDKMKGPPGGHLLTITADGPKARIFGVSFETSGPGVVYESIGPVGADAKVYLELGRSSFEQHLSAHAPDVVVLMVGGNDALKIRKKWTDEGRVEKDHQQLIDLVKRIVPGVEIVLWAPMDAGDKKGGKVVSKAYLVEVRAMQKRVAAEKQIAYWDTLDAMGGPGAITAWHAAKVMNKDLVHPKKRAADLLGDLFGEAFVAAVK